MLPVALVGADRHSGAWPAWPGDVGGFVDAAVKGASQPAIAVLRAAAVIAACSLAAELGVIDDVVTGDAAAPETQPMLNGPLVALASWTLAQGPQRLQHDLLSALGRAGLRLPPALLPTALDASRRSLLLRPLITPVLGTTGVWIAAQRDDWKHAAGAQTTDESDESRWSDGNLDQRRAFLQNERAHTNSNSNARERLMAVLPELPARERAELVAVLATGLSMDDEPLLDKLRADRSKEVKQVALNLLLRLPQAAHPQRAARRMEALLKQERVLLRKRWVIDAPNEIGSDWVADNIEPERPKHESFGERGWWLWQLAKRVSLSWWSTHTGMSPAELLKWAADGDWANALAHAWYDSLLAAPDAAWAEAFVDQWPLALKNIDQSPVVAMLTPAARDARWLQQARSIASLGDRLLPGLVAACQPPQILSAELSKLLVAWICERLVAPNVVQQWTLRAHLPELACVLHPTSLASLMALLAQPRSGDEASGMNELLNTLAQIIATRNALTSHLAEPTR